MEENMKIKIEDKEYTLINGHWCNEKGNRIRSKKTIDILNKEYEEHSLKNMKTSGLGDLIGKVTNKLGIEECEGCKKRKEKLNKLFPWLKSKREYTEEENEWVIDLGKRTQMSGEESNRLFKLYNEITGNKIQKCMCPGMHKVMVERLQKFTY